MAYISFQPHDHFNTVTYTGNETARTITVGFQPDWVWTKCRNDAHTHISTDSITGAGKRIKPNTTDVQDTSGASVASFVSTGYTLTDNSTINGNSDTNVSWNWKGNGTGSTNSDGSVSATVSANTTAGFSMVYYNTGSSGTQSMGHGLGSTPELIITRPMQNAESWYIYSEKLTYSNIVRFNSTNASASSITYSAAPTSSVFSVSNSAIGSYTGVMSWCFKSIKGFSKIGSYTGNGNNDGAFVYTGFKPNWVLIKRTGGSAQWQMRDGQRGFNGAIKTLYADSSEVETSGDTFDILSNGFKCRNTSNAQNASGETYIYMAFAEEPLVASNGDIATAR